MPKIVVLIAALVPFLSFRHAEAAGTTPARRLVVLPGCGASLEAPRGYEAAAALAGAASSGAAQGAVVLSPGGLLPQRRVTAASERELFRRFSLAAANVTPGEIEAARSLSGKGLPLVSANLLSGQRRALFPPAVTLSTGTEKLVVFGAVSELVGRMEGSEEGKDWTVGDPVAALKKAAAAYGPQTVRILLFCGSDDEALAAARAAGASLVILAGSPRGCARRTFPRVTFLTAPSRPWEFAVLPFSLGAGKVRLGPLSVKKVSPESAPPDLLSRLTEQGLLSPYRTERRLAPAPLPSAVGPGTAFTLRAQARNKAAEIGVTSFYLTESWGKESGGLFLVLCVRLTNRLPYVPVKEALAPVAYQVNNLFDHLFMRLDGRYVVPLDPECNSGLDPKKAPHVFLPRTGSRREFRCVFRCDAAPKESCELIFLDSEYGHIRLLLWGEAPREPALRTKKLTNPYFCFAAADWETRSRIGDVAPPPGKIFLVVTVAGKSVIKGEVRGKEADFVVKYDPFHYAQLLEDGCWGVRPVEAPLAWSFRGERPFLPEIFSYGSLVFPVAKDHGRLELQLFMPARRRVTSGQLREVKPRELTIPLFGTHRASDPFTSPWKVIQDGDLLEVAVGTPVFERGDLQVTCAVRNKNTEAEIVRPYEQILLQVGAEKRKASEQRSTSLRWGADPFLRIPPEGRRIFSLCFPRAGGAVALLYQGFTRGEALRLPSRREPVVAGAPKAKKSPPRTEEVQKKRSHLQQKVTETGRPRVEKKGLPKKAPAVTAGSLRLIQEPELGEWHRQEFATAVDLLFHGYGTRVALQGGQELEDLELLTDGDLESRVALPSNAVLLCDLLGGKDAICDRAGILLTYGVERLGIRVEGGLRGGAKKLLAEAHLADLSGPVFLHFSFDPVPVGSLRVALQASEEFTVAEVVAFEKKGTDPTESILSQGGMDLALRENGGCVFYADPRQAEQLLHLIDGKPGTTAQLFSEEGKEVSLVFAFKGNKKALLGGVAVRAAPAARAQDLPVGLRVEASEDDPFGTYRRVGECALKGREEVQAFDFPEVAWARLLRLTFRLHPGGTGCELAGISVFEGSEPAYRSVLLRAGESLSRRMPKEISLSSLAPGVTAAAEKEPNQEPAQAQPLSAGTWVRGTLSYGDTDSFRFSLGDDNLIPVLKLHMVPFLRGRIVLKPEGALPSMSVPITRSGTSVSVPLGVGAGTFTLSMSCSDACVLLGFDASGSMNHTFETTGKAMLTWAERMPRGLKVSLATSLEDEKESLPYTIFCPYTDEPAQIKEAVPKLFEEGGGSDWYDVIAGLCAHSDTTVPQDASSCVVYLADGNGSGDFAAMWKRLRLTHARLYTIGFGDVGREIDTDTGWDGQRGLFNVAWYCGGRYYEPHSRKELVEVYDSILGDFTQTPQYLLCVTLRQRMKGTLLTEAPGGEKRPVLFILDCSGSMSEEIEGRTRFAIAKEVMSLIIQKLPPETSVGLRVYGHRFRPFEGESAETDSELILPVAPLQKEKLLYVLRQLKARGGTPLAYSIRQAVEDLSGVDKPRVIIITDGVESFGGDPVKEAARLREGVPAAEVAVVGFAIGAQTDQALLRRMAQAAGGVYFNARGSAALIDSIDAALNPRILYTLWDWKGRIAVRGRFGDRHVVPEGRYTLRVVTSGGERAFPVTVHAGQEAYVPLPEGAVASVPGPEAPPKEKVPAAGARFCTNCGARLQPQARFCTHCGAKVAQ